MIYPDILIKIDGQLNVVCIADDLRTVEFLADGARLTERDLDPYHPEEEYIKGGHRTLLIRDEIGDGCTVQFGESLQSPTFPSDDMGLKISDLVKIDARSHSYYVSKINEETYATSRADMMAKIQGPLPTELNITWSSEDIEYRRDRRIYLPVLDSEKPLNND